MRVAPRSVGMALVWAVLAASPLAVAGLCDGAWSPHAALGGVLGLSVTVLPLLWAAMGADGARARGAEFVLLVSAGLPALTVSASFSGVNDGAALLGLLYCLAVLGLVAGLLARAGPLQRSKRFAFCAAWLVALPVGLHVWTDVATAPMTAVAPAFGLGEILAGRPSSAPFAALLILALGVAGVEVWRSLRAARPTLGAVGALAVVAGLGLALAETGAAQPSASVRAVLGTNVRPGDPYPLRIQQAGGGVIAARSYRHRFSVRIGDGAGSLAPTPVGSGRRLELLRESSSGEWQRLDLTLPEPSVVSPQTLLVGTLGPGVQELAGGWFPPGEAVVLPLESADLPLIAQAGEALDVVIVAPGLVRDEVATHLRAWAAAGGALVLTDATDLARAATVGDVHDLAAAGALGVRPEERARLRPIGSGLLVGPADGDRLRAGALPPALRERLAQRLHRRARRRAVQEAVLRAPSPGPSEALTTRAALACLAAALCFGLLAPLRSRVSGSTFVGGSALVGLLLALTLEAIVSPSVPVYATSRTILEAPAGARAAGRLRLLTCAATRPTQASVSIPGRAVPRSVFSASQDAIRADVAIHTDRQTGSTIDMPLTRARRTFVRQDAADLGGVFRLTRGAGGRQIRIENRSPMALRDAFALVRGGLYPLSDLAPGASLELDLLTPPIPFRRWRLSALDRASRSWRQLVTAALTGRDLEGSLLLIGRTDGDPQVVDGVAEERVHSPLLVITASRETR